MQINLGRYMRNFVCNNVRRSHSWVQLHPPYFPTTKHQNLDFDLSVQQRKIVHKEAKEFLTFVELATRPEYSNTSCSTYNSACRILYWLSLTTDSHLCTNSRVHIHLASVEIYERAFKDYLASFRSWLLLVLSLKYSQTWDVGGSAAGQLVTVASPTRFWLS